VLVLAACTGNAATCTAPPVTAPAPVTPTLLSPASGATGVSSGPLDVTIGNAASAVSLYLKNSALAADAPGNFYGATNYRPANPPSYDIRIGTFSGLASQTTYQVYADVLYAPSYNPCGPNSNAILVKPTLLGTFTTQ
jgi:hypothetical protein